MAKHKWGHMTGIATHTHAEDKVLGNTDREMESWSCGLGAMESHAWYVNKEVLDASLGNWIQEGGRGEGGGGGMRENERQERGRGHGLPAMLPVNLASSSWSISSGSFQLPSMDSTPRAGVGTECSFFFVHTYVCFSTRATSDFEVRAR